MTMTDLTAKPIVKDKFWIVERDGEKVATIQAIEEGGFAYVHDQIRDHYATVKTMKNKLDIEFLTAARAKATIVKSVQNTNEVYGWPTNFKPYNNLYDVSKKLPIFTKSAKSKSYFCAGYYAVKFNNTWTRAYCPKLITLQRYEYRGPFHTKEQMLEELRKANGE
jgi:hypothetical protein